MEYIYDGVSLRNGRTQNMDSMLLTTRTIGACHALLAVICDGVGSLTDGAFASSTAVRLMNKWFAGIADADRIGLRMRDAALDINREIIKQTQYNGMKTATTLSALLLVDEKYHIVNAGDSRVYCFEDDRLTQLTRDDVSEDGKLTACVGRLEQPFLTYLDGTNNGGTFLLCSDGLYKRMDLGFLTSTLHLKNPRDIRSQLVRLTDFVMDRGELDNITIALVKAV